MCIIKSITNGWRHLNNDNKGMYSNSGHNKITHNKGDFRDDVSSIGATLESMTSRRQIQDGGPHGAKMAAPTTPRWRPPRNQDGGPCDAFGYTSEGESTP